MSKYHLLLISFAVTIIFCFGLQIHAGDQKPAVFYQPFPVLFEDHDIHVMLYFNGHPEYEAVEAMIRKRASGEPLIRAIVTRHDQTQTDYINDSKFVTHKGADRETYYANIQYSQTYNDGKPAVYLSFETKKKEKIELYFYAVGKPLEKYGGLTDPEGHAEKSALPVMYRKKSTLASRESKVLIDGVQYKIPRKIWIPLFFTGMKGYYSDNFLIGVLFTGYKELKAVRTPLSLNIGEKWVYRVDDVEKAYTITEKRENMLTITSDNEIIIAEIINEQLAIKEIQVFSPFDERNNNKFTLEFDSPLFITGKGLEDNYEVAFDISINEYAGLVTGTVKRENNGEGLVFRLNPANPRWAMKRAMVISVFIQGDQILIKSITD